MKKTWLIAILVGIVSFAGITMVLAGVLDSKKTIVIDHLPGKKGAVAFEHAKHADTYKKAGDKSIGCKDCHHTFKENTPVDPKSVKACTDCHVMDGAAQKEYEGKKAPVLGSRNEKGDDFLPSGVLYHKTCQGCHKEMKKEGKKIDACTNCHKK